MTPAHNRLLRLLRLRSGPQVMHLGGRPAFAPADVIERFAKDALSEFMSLDRIRTLDETSREIVKRLFLRSIVLLNVASELNTTKAERICRITNEITGRILAPKPKLTLVQ